MEFKPMKIQAYDKIYLSQKVVNNKKVPQDKVFFSIYSHVKHQDMTNL